MDIPLPFCTEKDHFKEPAFTKVHTDVVDAAAPIREDIIHKEEADTTHGKSKNKKKNKKNRNTKSITETNPPEITISDSDKHADAEVAAVNAGNASPPIQVHEISSTEEKASNGHTGCFLYESSTNLYF